MKLILFGDLVRRTISFEPTIYQAIENYRSQKRPIPDFTEAVNTLLGIQLGTLFICKNCGATTKIDDVDYKQGHLYESLKQEGLCENCSRNK